MASLRLHVEEPAGEFDPIPFPTTLASRVRRAGPPSWRRSQDSIRLVEDAMHRVERQVDRLSQLIDTGDDDHPRAA